MCIPDSIARFCLGGDMYPGTRAFVYTLLIAIDGLAWAYMAGLATIVVVATTFKLAILLNTFGPRR